MAPSLKLIDRLRVFWMVARNPIAVMKTLWLLMKSALALLKVCWLVEKALNFPTRIAHDVSGRMDNLQVTKKIASRIFDWLSFSALFNDYDFGSSRLSSGKPDRISSILIA